LLLGFHMLSIGLIAEMITAANHEPRESYSIRELLVGRSQADQNRSISEQESAKEASV
jgi:hypothetical protein